MSTAGLTLIRDLIDAGEVAEHLGEEYVTVPTSGYQEAVEVEYIDNTYYVSLRAWDRSGGLSHEVEVGDSRYPAKAARLARNKLAEVNAEYDRLEALFAEADEEAQ